MMADVSARVNELLSLDLGDDPEGKMVSLRLIDSSTEKEYIIRVPPDQKTVRGALAWSHNMAEEEYVLEQET